MRPHDICVDAREAGSLYRSLKPHRDDLDAGSDNACPPSAFLEQFAAALLAAEVRMAELLGHSHPTCSAYPKGTSEP